MIASTAGGECNFLRWNLILISVCAVGNKMIFMIASMQNSGTMLEYLFNKTEIFPSCYGPVVFSFTETNVMQYFYNHLRCKKCAQRNISQISLGHSTRKWHIKNAHVRTQTSDCSSLTYKFNK